MGELEVLMLMLVLLSPLFFGVGFFVGYRSGKANEQRQSIYDAKEQAKETRIAIEEARVKVIEELFNLNCKDISQDECDAYCGNCFHCQFDRIKGKANQIKEQK